MAWALAAKLACVSITPLGTPVVPEVYISKAMACGAGAAVCVGGKAASRLSGAAISGLHTSKATARGSVASTACTRSAHSGLAITRRQSLCSRT